MTKPISPDEVVDKKRESLPDEVIEAFNELIAERWSGKHSHFKQKDVVALILEKMNYGKVAQRGITSDTLFKNHWLDVEDIYSEIGWQVTYDSPAYNENYDATFEFVKRKSGRRGGSGVFMA